MINIETLHQALLKGVYEHLPAALEKHSYQPLRWLHRSDDGVMTWCDLVVKLPMLEELWAEQHVTLNYPALIIHYRESNEVEVTECEEVDTTAIFQCDLILTHDNPEVLNFLWLRYAEAVKTAVRSINFGVSVQTPGQRITESGPDESLYLRRGLIDLQITF